MRVGAHNDIFVQLHNSETGSSDAVVAAFKTWRIPLVVLNYVSILMALYMSMYIYAILLFVHYFCFCRTVFLCFGGGGGEYLYFAVLISIVWRFK